MGAARMEPRVRALAAPRRASRATPTPGRLRDRGLLDRRPTGARGARRLSGRPRSRRRHPGSRPGVLHVATPAPARRRPPVVVSQSGPTQRCPATPRLDRLGDERSRASLVGRQNRPWPEARRLRRQPAALPPEGSAERGIGSSCRKSKRLRCRNWMRSPEPSRGPVKKSDAPENSSVGSLRIFRRPARRRNASAGSYRSSGHSSCDTSVERGDDCPLRVTGIVPPPRNRNCPAAPGRLCDRAGSAGATDQPSRRRVRGANARGPRTARPRNPVRTARPPNPVMGSENPR